MSQPKRNAYFLYKYFLEDVRRFTYNHGEVKNVKRTDVKEWYTVYVLSLWVLPCTHATIDNRIDGITTQSIDSRE